ncbi:putative ribonuclease H-like domain-containing protein [Tanacetum coccineum]
MDVKSAFLYDTIEEEVYVCQPPGFVDLKFPKKVYKVKKALYGLHQAPRAWYETLSTYLLDNRFHKGQIDKTLFIKRLKGDILLVQVYVDDINFGLTKKSLCDDFEQIMHNSIRTASTLMETNKASLTSMKMVGCDVFIQDSPLRLEAFSDSEYACASLDRKSTTGGCQFLGSSKRGWDTKIPQSGGLLIKVGDEAVYKELGDRMERAATTDSSLEVEQDSENPTIYVSFIKQFWKTTTARTSTNREVELTPTIDAQVKTITKASLRRYLKLEDNSANSEIFEQLALMGYVTDSDKLTFRKGHFSPQWKFLIHTIFHCLCPKKTAWEQFKSGKPIQVFDVPKIYPNLVKQAKAMAEQEQERINFEAALELQKQLDETGRGCC